ncbi:MAG: hypothetical protein WCQ95_07270 [Bacteroidota bacterium]
MKKIKYIIASIIILSLLCCKKYEDGPCISFRKAKKKIATEWQVEYFSIDGSDDTKLYQNTCGCNFKFTEKFTTGYDPNVFDFTNCIGNIYDIRGSYDFANNKKTIKISSGGFIGNPDSIIHYIGPIGTGFWSEWSIKRFTKTELWIETSYNNYQYFIKFKSL